jgi:hypothetical protein
MHLPGGGHTIRKTSPQVALQVYPGTLLTAQQDHGGKAPAEWLPSYRISLPIILWLTYFYYLLQALLMVS